MVQAVANKQGVEVNVTKVTDMAEIVMAGILSTPGIIIDGKIVHSGGLPKESDLAVWLRP